MLGPDGQPLARKYYAEKTGKDLDADETVRGYEVADNKFVIVTDEELERLAPEKTRDIDLKQFVPADSIPPTYFEHGYFLVPAAGSQKAYKLLAGTMEKNGLAGIATFVMRGKEYLVAIFADNGLSEQRRCDLRMSCARRKTLDCRRRKRRRKPTVRKFEKFIANKSKKQFSPTKLADKQADSLLKLVKKKQSKRGNVVRVEDEMEKDHKVIDLVQILKKSLSGKR